MSDTLLNVAGIGAMFVAIVHGYLGATKVVAPASHPSASSKRILHALMFLSAVYWFAAGVFMTLAPRLMAGDVRRNVVYICAAMLFSGALGNLWGMRGKHFGGYLLLFLAVLAFFGA